MKWLMTTYCSPVNSKHQKVVFHLLAKNGQNANDTLLLKKKREKIHTNRLFCGGILSFF
jgi:hypothetical protein